MTGEDQIGRERCERVERTERERRVAIETVGRYLRADAARERVPRGQGVAGDEHPLPLEERIAQLPSVCPGACTMRGVPGTSIVSPSPNVDTSWIGTIFRPLRRMSPNNVRYASGRSR